jgi:Tetratricopeptide repeat/Peptidase MA superfamily
MAPMHRSRLMSRTRWLAVLLTVLSSAAPAAQNRSAAAAERAGWTAIRVGQAQEAAAAFRDALRLEPRSAESMLGAGLAEFLLGQLDDARQHLETALQVDPSMAEASRLLGYVLYRKGDVDGAIQVYEQALTRGPGDAMIASRLDAWRHEAELHGRFNQRLGDHFTVLFEGPAEEAIAARTVELLEAAYWRIGTAIGTFPNEPITVILYTQEQFKDITRSPSWAAGAYDGRIRVPMRGALQNPRELDRILCHEFTHALVHGVAPRGVPQWLNEGLALLFEPSRTPAADNAPLRAPGPAGAVVPLTRLEDSFEGLSDDEARRAYVESGDAVQALVAQSGMPAILNLLQNLGTGMRFDDAFERSIGMRYEEFQRVWSQPR